MKNPRTLRRENEILIRTFGRAPIIDNKEVKSARRKIAANNKMIEVLESGIIEETLERDIKILSERVTEMDKESSFMKWLGNTPSGTYGSDAKKTYVKEMNLQHLRRQLKFLESIQ